MQGESTGSQALSQNSPQGDLTLFFLFPLKGGSINKMMGRTENRRTEKRKRGSRFEEDRRLQRPRSVDRDGRRSFTCSALVRLLTDPAAQRRCGRGSYCRLTWPHYCGGNRQCEGGRVLAPLDPIFHLSTKIPHRSISVDLDN